MHRLPLINMRSREAKRSATEIVALLGCEAMLPLELAQSITSIKPSEKFFVYYLYPGEIGFHRDTHHPGAGTMFILVEVSGAKETVLDYGSAGTSNVSDEGYQYSEVTGEKIGHYDLFCSYHPRDEQSSSGKQLDPHPHRHRQGWFD